jgi:hypothetical protein
LVLRVFSVPFLRRSKQKLGMGIENAVGMHPLITLVDRVDQKLF